MSINTVSKFRLTNNGGFVCDIHALYFDENGMQLEAKNGDNFPVLQTRTMNLGEKCTGIYKGSMVQLKVWIMWGSDNTFRQGFAYDPAGPIQTFKISGTTLNSSIEWTRPAS